jgi:hypothetical protein
MANHYFKNVPDFEYVNRDPNNQEISNYAKVKNLFKRAKIREDIFKNLSFFENYEIVGDERPDNVAYKFYRDETLDWVVLLANNILNIQSEWPLPQNAFTKILLEKYGSYDNLYNIRDKIEDLSSLKIDDIIGINRRFKRNIKILISINIIFC